MRSWIGRAAAMIAMGVVSLFPGGAAAQSFWPQFRGPNGQGVATDARPPVRFGKDLNRRWRTPVAGGLSSPVVWGRHLFLTTYETGRLSVVGFDRAEGGEQWRWSVPAGPVGDVHTVSSPAAPTPAVDGDRVYAYFGSWGLVALEHGGREVWRRELPPPRNRYGMATSPVLYRDLVVLVLDADDLKSRVVAFAKDDGRVRWETERPGQRATWSTPAIWSPASGAEGDALIVLSAMRLAAYDPRDGREMWTLDGFPQETVSVPVVGGGLVYAGAAALGGRGNERYDAMGWQRLLVFDRNADGRVQVEEIPDDFRMVLRPDLPPDHPGYAVPFAFKRDFKNRDTDRDGALTEAEWNRSVASWEASSRPVLMAVRPGPLGQDGAVGERVVWKVARGLPEMPSFLYYRDRLYLLRDGGLLTCLDPADGRVIYQDRVGVAGQYIASPVAADGRIYLASGSGTVTVVAAGGDRLEVLARNEVGEAIHATPALVENRVYVRTTGHLMAFGEDARGPETEGDVAFETRTFRYVIGPDGANRQFIDRRTGTNHCLAAPTSYFATLNKNGRQYPGAVEERAAGRLRLRFGDSGSTAMIEVAERGDSLTFELRELTDEAGITEVSLLNLQLDLDGEPGEPFAACAVDLNLQTFNAHIPGHNRALRVYCQPRDGLVGAKVAVVGGPGAELRSLLQRVVRDHPDLPRSDLGGPWALDAPGPRGSYLIEMGQMNERNVGDWIEMARSLGVRQIDLHCGKTLRFGDLEPDRKAYPTGFDGVRECVRKLHEAGLGVGLHTYAFYLAKDSTWVSPVPDPRLGKHRLFTLAAELDLQSTTVPVEESTREMSTITGFQIPNSVTLQIDDELIAFSGLATNPPYAFTGCTRGAWGTRAAPHSRSARVSQLRELFGLFSPDGDSTLFEEIARRTAEVYNDCGFDMIYLDAIDGAGALAGRHSPAWYQGKFIFELNRHLRKPALMEMSAFDSHFWFARSRMGAWDVPSKAYRLFINAHCAENRIHARSFLPRNLGWWAVWDWTPRDRLRMFPEDIEYLLCKSLASGDSLSWIESFSPGSFDRSASQKRFAGLIRQYEELRLADHFPAATRRRLAEPDRDFTLEPVGDGDWQFRPVGFDRHAVTGANDGSCVWKTRNPFTEQPLQVRIEAGLSLASYDDPRGQTVEDFADPALYGDRQSSPEASFSLASAPAPENRGFGGVRVQAGSGSPSCTNAWFLATRRFAAPVDFSRRGFGVWVHGDGRGGVLNFLWKAPASVCMGLDEHYVVVDFTGWKYLEFLEPESERVGTYPWPYRVATGAPYVETAWVAYDRIDSLTLGGIGLPEGQGMTCHVGPIRALPQVPVRLRNPAVTVGGRKLVFPLELESGQYVELRSAADATVYGPNGGIVRTIRPQGERPILRAGENELRFECGLDAPVNVRAHVTVLSRAANTFGK